MPFTIVTNLCREGKVMLKLSVVRYQVLLCLDLRYRSHCYKQAMKVKLQVFYHILSYKSAAGSGFLKV